MEKEEFSTEALVTTYLKMRDEIARREEEHADSMAVLKEQYATVADKLLEVCTEHNADSMKTPAGTVSRRVQARYWTSDWDSLRSFVQEHDAFDLLEKRINNNNMKSFLEENPDLFPAGLQCDRKFVIQVRKPTKK
jgi:hypothetical protein